MFKTAEIHVDEEEARRNYWLTYASRILINTVSHPIEYAKVLIQLGYEPIAPRPTTTYFGKPALKMPNVFEYVHHIKKVDGVFGLYNGFVPKLWGSLICAVTTEQIQIFLNKDEPEPPSPVNDVGEEVDTNLYYREKFIRDLKREICSRTTAIIISQPFHVMTVRMMAQFIGKETTHCGFFNTICEIYRQNGLAGFFSGLFPRLLGDLILVLLASSLTFAANSYIVDDVNLRMYTSATLSFIISSITYPFQVVSNCMAVSDSGLMAGSAPFMPPYPTWTDCWFDLSSRHQLKRGSSLLIRYYTGPQVIISGRPVPLPKNDNLWSNK